MKLGKILGIAGKVVVTGASLLAGGPPAAVAVGTSLLGGDVGKKAGKKLEAKTGRRAQKVAGPIGAVALPAILVPLLGQLGLDTAQLCEVGRPIAEAMCNNPSAATAGVSLATILGWHLATNAKKAAEIQP